MRQDPDFFGEVDLPLLYIAKKLKESLQIEKVFTDAGIDYLVEPDSYRGGIIFQTERIGAFFYCSPEAEQQARGLLLASGYKPYQAD